MELFIRVRQGLTALELVFRRAAREVDLRPQEAWVLALCAVAREPVSGSWVAEQTGRSRMQVQPTLVSLRDAGLLTAQLRASGRVAGWQVTPRGLTVARALGHVMDAWLAPIDQRVSLEDLARSLERVVMVAVNQPGSRGWRAGLTRPRADRTGELRLAVRQLLEAGAAPGSAGLVPIHDNSAGEAVGVSGVVPIQYNPPQAASSDASARAADS
jgi:hypothetical protein